MSVGSGEKILHYQTDARDDVFWSAAGMTVQQRPPIFAFANGEARISVTQSLAMSGNGAGGGVFVLTHGTDTFEPANNAIDRLLIH